MLLGLSGYAQSGKDTIAAILEERGFLRAGFADALREFAVALDPIVLTDGTRYSHLLEILGYEGAKKFPEVRLFLQKLGTDAGRRVLGEDIWVETAMNRLEPDKSYVFTDVRFPNEAGAVRDRGGVLWRIDRPGYGPVNGHPSETAIDDYDFDRRIVNDGTLDDLRVAVLCWLGALL